MRAALVLLVVALAVPPVWAQEDDPQVQEIWAGWLEDPLDLTRASAAEIALLPWVDREQAALIEGLAREGGLASLDDLALVPGLDAETIAALDPFVTLEAPGAAGAVWTWHWSQDESFERRERAGFRRTLRGRGPHLAAALRWRDSRSPRGWGRVEAGGWTLAGGSLRGRPGTALLGVDRTVRSRTAALSSRLDPGPSWSGSLSSAAPERALALSRESRGLRATAFAVAEDNAPLSGWAEVRVKRDSLAWGLAAGVAERLEGAVWWRRRRGEVTLRAEAAGSGRAWRSAAATVWAPDRWRIGLAAAHAFEARGSGRDPITLLPLDREHRSWQLSLRRRWSSATLSALLRRLHRGDPPRRESRSRMRLWLRVDLDPPWAAHRSGRWQLLLRLGRDEEGGDRSTSTETRDQVRLELRRRTGGLRQRLVLSRRGRSGAASRAMTAQVDGTGAWRWRVVYATAAGERSHPWGAGLPHAGLYLHWLSPGENVVLLGAGRRRGRLVWGTWIASSWSDRQRTSWEGGASLRWSVGGRP